MCTRQAPLVQGQVLSGFLASQFRVACHDFAGSFQHARPPGLVVQDRRGFFGHAFMKTTKNSDLNWIVLVLRSQGALGTGSNEVLNARPKRVGARFMHRCGVHPVLKHCLTK